MEAAWHAGGHRRWFRRRNPLLEGDQPTVDRVVEQRMPAWLTSLVVHLALLLVLALIPIRRLADGPINIFLGGSAGDAGDFALEVTADGDASDLTEALDSTEPLVSASPSVDFTMLDLPLLNEPGVASPALDVPSGILKGLAGRSGSLKGALLAKFGGSRETEEAVELGLRWLAAQQKSNGSWSLRGPYRDGGASENTTAATAMALNAFLGAGHTHRDGSYQANVKLGLDYLVRRQKENGFFSDREPSRQQMYAQALASIAVAEAYGMTGDSFLRVPAERAMQFAAWSQSPLHGWRYHPREDADLSVTGWFVMALQTGRMAGLQVDEEKLQSVSKFLDTVSHEDQALYAYTEIEPPSLSMTAEGLLCRIYLGWPRTHPALIRAIQEGLLPARPSVDDTDFSVYYWYYATQVLHHFGGRPWQQWNDAMKATIPALQERDGPEAGSWAPGRDMFGASGGRLYTTCFHIYCLEVYYRHLAIYDIED
ncbi:MAG: squalene--hopene cyclase [Planctomycetota bacterium]|nr:MAG: squalene--hopene cyclase [Planctomycetota bacterium]